VGLTLIQQLEKFTESCAGIVKAAGVFPKNPGQHLADIEMLEGTTEVAPAFLNPVTEQRKQIECPTDDPTLRPTPELGMVTRLPDKPGCYLRHEGRHGQIYKRSSYSDVLIPVLHHGAVASGVDKWVI